MRFAFCAIASKDCHGQSFSVLADCRQKPAIFGPDWQRNGNFLKFLYARQWLFWVIFFRRTACFALQKMKFSGRKSHRKNKAG